VRAKRIGSYLTSERKVDDMDESYHEKEQELWGGSLIETGSAKIRETEKERTDRKCRKSSAVSHLK